MTPITERDLLWIVVGILLGLICYFVDGSVVLGQSQRTSYDAGRDRICETFDGMGNPISKSRCHKSGQDTRCETKSINGGATTTPLIPNGGRPER